jgi:hypothetical protein
MKYSFMSQPNGSCSPLDASSTCQRQAIGNSVAKKIAAAARRYSGLLEAMYDAVSLMSILQTR